MQDTARTITTNQPTNRAPNEPARLICAQESIFLDKNGRFWAKHPNYVERGQKFWYPLIRTGLFEHEIDEKKSNFRVQGMIFFKNRIDIN